MWGVGRDRERVESWWLLHLSMGESVQGLIVKMAEKQVPEGRGREEQEKAGGEHSNEFLSLLPALTTCSATPS